jgi:glycosyltransferase involved in cell wall biosynthesis
MDKRCSIRKQLEIPIDSYVVVSCGTTDWNKGSDLFIQLSQQVYKISNHRNIYFLWVGGESESVEFKLILSEINKIGLQDHVMFLGKKRNPIDIFNASDFFVLLSREESFGRVVLEAASVGKPILCFDNSGGVTEFVNDDVGRVVPYLDVHSMANEIISLIQNPDIYQTLSRNSREKSKYYSTDLQAPKLLSIIERYIDFTN